MYIQKATHKYKYRNAFLGITLVHSWGQSVQHLQMYFVQKNYLHKVKQSFDCSKVEFQGVIEELPNAKNQSQNKVKSKTWNLTK